VSLAIKAAHILKERGIIAEIVSMPSLELLEECGRDFMKRCSSVRAAEHSL
jgi:transketolase